MQLREIPIAWIRELECRDLSEEDCRQVMHDYMMQGYIREVPLECAFGRMKKVISQDEVQNCNSILARVMFESKVKEYVDAATVATAGLLLLTTGLSYFAPNLTKSLVPWVFE